MAVSEVWDVLEAVADEKFYVETVEGRAERPAFIILRPDNYLNPWKKWALLLNQVCLLAVAHKKQDLYERLQAIMENSKPSVRALWRGKQLFWSRR